MAITRALKEHLPKLQFVAVVITIALGTHTVYDRFLRGTTPVLLWDESGFSVRPGPAPHTWQVTVARRKLRNDCPLKSFDAGIIDADGFAHSVVNSANRTVGLSSDGKVETFSWVMRMTNHDSVAAGKARLTGTLVYECREGQQVIDYPRTHRLEFEVTRAN